mmetsp:Transcript_17248/g.65801  ORF Transcript_17248/g.65801 Transcript_17248/m.65801 type:complete len:333 (-) Transcript_17248:375-1373(-)
MHLARLHISNLQDMLPNALGYFIRLPNRHVWPQIEVHFNGNAPRRPLAVHFRRHASPTAVCVSLLYLIDVFRIHANAIVFEHLMLERALARPIHVVVYLNGRDALYLWNPVANDRPHLAFHHMRQRQQVCARRDMISIPRFDLQGHVSQSDVLVALQQLKPDVLSDCVGRACTQEPFHLNDDVGYQMRATPPRAEHKVANQSVADLHHGLGKGRLIGQTSAAIQEVMDTPHAKARPNLQNHRSDNQAGDGVEQRHSDSRSDHSNQSHSATERITPVVLRVRDEHRAAHLVSDAFREPIESLFHCKRHQADCRCNAIRRKMLPRHLLESVWQR